MRLSAIGLMLTLALGFLVAPLCSNAQQTVKVPLLGVLGVGRYPTEAQWQQSPFVQKLHELGWHEGHNIAVERRYADAVAGNGRPLSWAPSADAVAGGGSTNRPFAWPHYLHDWRTSPVDVDGDTREVAGPVRGQERDHVAGLLGFAEPAQRHAAGFHSLGVQFFHRQIGVGRFQAGITPLVLTAFDEPDADCVHQDIVLGQIA